MRRKKLYWLEVFQKLEILVEILKNLEILENYSGGGRACSTRHPSGNLVDGSPLVAIEWRQSGTAHAGSFHYENDIFN